MQSRHYHTQIVGSNGLEKIRYAELSGNPLEARQQYLLWEEKIVSFSGKIKI